jgi:predicted TIM-barrel fold metal-dependent hydrolase
MRDRSASVPHRSTMFLLVVALAASPSFGAGDAPASDAAAPSPSEAGAPAPVPPPAPDEATGPAATEAPATGPTAEAAAPTFLIDHHVHLLGEGLIADWKAAGVTFSRPDEVYLSPASLFEGGAGGVEVRRVVLVPMGHLYGREGFRTELGLSLAQEQAGTVRENDHAARQAARFPGRAVALCSVAALRPYARAELERCRVELGSAGVKLHLASSNVDLREPAHLLALAEIAKWAAGHELPILLHLDTQLRGTAAADVARFARTVLEPHPELVVVVAHLGGSGGYGPWTRSVFRTLLDWLEERQAAGKPRSNVYFELSAVLLENESEGVPATTPEEAAALAADVRAAGLERFVFGSDYPVFDPRRGVVALREVAGLTAAEVASIAANGVPGWTVGDAP